jgi:hypothetical protein
MKTKNRQILAMSTVIALTLSIAITSCKKDKDDSGSSVQFSATVNGTAFKPNLVTAAELGDYIVVMGYEYKSGDTALIELTLPDTITVNSKLTFDDAAGLDYYKGKVNYGNWGDSHGTVSFTTVDKSTKKIVGSFNGVLYKPNNTTDSVVIKDGTFNTTYTSF